MTGKAEARLNLSKATVLLLQNNQAELDILGQVFIGFGVKAIRKCLTLGEAEDCIRSGIVRSAHDCSEGGLAVALAECAMMDRDRMRGATVDLSTWASMGPVLAGVLGSLGSLCVHEAGEHVSAQGSRVAHQPAGRWSTRNPCIAL